MKVLKNLNIIIFLILPLALFAGETKKFNILILGNSITFCPPNPLIGWNGNWGMAASSADKDFESILFAKLKESNNFKKFEITLNVQNIAIWEQDFNFDINQISALSDKKNYDLIIVRLGENVNEIGPNFYNYEKALSALINKFKCKNAKVIITGTVWSSVKKDLIQKKVASDNDYFYIPLIDFQANPKNYATGQFKNEQVSAHPSDFGMNTIATLLYDKIVLIFK